jgi:type I restriction enzyme S subunit
MSKLTLGDVAEYSSYRISLEEISISNYVTTDNLEQNKKGKIDAEKLPPQTGNVTQFEKGNILISNIRPYLKKIWFADEIGGNSADVLTLIVNNHFNSEFIYYCLHHDSFFEHMMNGSKGTKMPRGDKTQILDYPIPNFEINTQNQIAKALSDLDAKIELNNKINAELEGMAKLIYDYWFVQFEFPFDLGASRLRSKTQGYKSSGGKMVFNQEVKREIPEGWEVKTIDNLLAKEQLGGKTPSSEYLSSGNVPIIDQSTKFICGYTNDDTKRIKAKVPRIVFGDHTRILKLINFDFARGADGTQVLLSKELRVPQHFFYHSLLKIDLSNYGYARHFKFLKDSKTIIPTLEVVTKYESKTKIWYDMIWKNKKQNQELSSLRDWLLPMLMNGQVSASLSTSTPDSMIKKEYGKDLEAGVGMAAESEGEYK